MQAIWDSNNYSTTFANIGDMDVSPGYVISPCAVTRKLGTSYWTYMWWSSPDDVPYHFLASRRSITTRFTKDHDTTTLS
jgi:hypothetical protein